MAWIQHRSLWVLYPLVLTQNLLSQACHKTDQSYEQLMWKVEHYTWDRISLASGTNWDLLWALRIPFFRSLEAHMSLVLRLHFGEDTIGAIGDSRSRRKWREFWYGKGVFNASYCGKTVGLLPCLHFGYLYDSEKQPIWGTISASVIKFVKWTFKPKRIFSNCH